MKYALMLCLFMASLRIGSAQTNNGTGRKSAAKKTTITRKTTVTTPKQRGTGQYYGSRDTTPGSPMGTGGAGGDGMSGSPAGSALETKEQQSKTPVKHTTTTNNKTGTQNKNKGNQ